MKIGFLTSVLKGKSFEEVVEWASRAGFEALEVSADPQGLVRPDEALSGKAGWIRRKLEDHGLIISSLDYYTNILSGGENEKKQMQEHFRRVIETAAQLDVPVVGALAGVPKKGKKEDCVGIVAEFYSPVAEYAKEHGVKIAFEIWYATVAYNPPTWDMLFSLIGLRNVGLNFDPSHLYWQHIDYLWAVRRFGDRIFHVHAKDTEILYDKIRFSGLLSRGWWRYRIPGWGEIDWPTFISALKDVGYDYVLSIEHEDPLMSAETGLIKGLEYLKGVVF